MKLFEWQVELNKIINMDEQNDYLTDLYEEIQEFQGLGMYLSEQIAELYSASYEAGKSDILKMICDSGISDKVNYFHDLSYAECGSEDRMLYEIDPSLPAEDKCDQLIQDINDLYSEIRQSIQRYKEAKYDIRCIGRGLERIWDLEKRKEAELDPNSTVSKRESLLIDYLGTTLAPLKAYKYRFINQDILDKCIAASKKSEKRVCEKRAKIASGVDTKHTDFLSSHHINFTPAKKNNRISRNEISKTEPGSHVSINVKNSNAEDSNDYYVKLVDQENDCHKTSYCTSIKKGILSGMLISGSAVSAYCFITDSSIWASTFSLPMLYTFLTTSIACSIIDYKNTQHSQDNESTLTMSI
jgi:hypothetical protein